MAKAPWESVHSPIDPIFAPIPRPRLFSSQAPQETPVRSLLIKNRIIFLLKQIEKVLAIICLTVLAALFVRKTFGVSLLE